VGHIADGYFSQARKCARVLTARCCDRTLSRAHAWIRSPSREGERCEVSEGGNNWELRYPRQEIISISGSVGLAERCSAISEIVCFERRDNALSRILFVYLTTIALLSPARFGVELFLANTLIGCPISIAIEKARQVHNRTRTRKSSNRTVAVVVVVVVVAAVVVIAYESKYRLKFNF